MTPQVAWIHVAPVKALGISSVSSATIGPRGIAEDRRFCIVDEQGRMLNAKRVHAFVSVRPELVDGELRLHMRDGRVVSAPVALGDPLDVQIYGRAEPARVVEGPFADALSRIDGGRSVRLVRFEGDGEGFDRSADGGAITLLSTAALDALAAEAGAGGPVDPRRFRMNIGIDGVAAHVEDGWMEREVGIGDAVVVPRGNVGRCAVTTLDPDSAESDLDTLGALQRYRGAQRTTEALPFGVWAAVVRPGTVRVGDAVTF